MKCFYHSGEEVMIGDIVTHKNDDPSIKQHWWKTLELPTKEKLVRARLINGLSSALISYQQNILISRET